MLFIVQVKLATWGALICALAAVANMRTHEADVKQIMSSFTCVRPLPYPREVFKDSVHFLFAVFLILKIVFYGFVCAALQSWD